MIDYEKKYNEALSTAKKLYNEAKSNEYTSDMEDYERIFPELRESEDERIRKFLVKHVSEWIGCIEHDLKISSKDVESEEELAMFKAGLAYLEKQKEHSMSAEEVLARAGLKPYKDGNKWCILAGDNIQEGICGFGDTIDEALYEFLKEVIDLQKEQQKIPLMNGDAYLYFDNWIQHNDTTKRGCFEEGIRYAQRLQKEQKPAEWSEEDEAKKERLISIVKRALHGNEYPLLNDDGATELITWLKSLRPQPHWKPSEEQMEALMWTITWLVEEGNHKNSSTLADLRRELQKLM